MPIEPLDDLPDTSDIFIDANIFIYGLSGQSAQCRRLLERCSREEVTGMCLFEILNEATHRFMLAEATSKRLISKENHNLLKQRFNAIPTLTEYWRDTERILSLNLLFLGTDEPVIRGAQAERESACLLTNDSMIISCMREYGVSFLASRDADFARARDIVVYQPNDIP